MMNFKIINYLLIEKKILKLGIYCEINKEGMSALN